MVKRKPVASRVSKRGKKSRVRKARKAPIETIDPGSGKPKKMRLRRSKEKIQAQYINAKKLRNPDEPETLASGIYCSVVDKNCTVATCALGMCGEFRCPHYRGKHETQLLLDYYQDKEIPPASRLLFDIVIDKKTGEKKVTHKVSF